MRDAFANAVIKYRNTDDSFFLTGDLGFMALENIQKSFGPRFINAGVAEQNMISVAAGIANEGNKVMVYSIAPFCYARPFEQIRNDIGIGKLPVLLVGNGGGYAYGHMGPTHHALEDCAAMDGLGIRVIIPAFDEDIEDILKSSVLEPTYLRLGYDCRPEGISVPKFAPWRLVLEGHSGVMVVLGPLAGEALNALLSVSICDRPALWVVSEYSFNNVPDTFFHQVNDSVLYVFEEHVRSGGIGMNISFMLFERHIKVRRFIHKYALGYPTGRFGSQKYHRNQCGIDSGGIFRSLVS
jgi:transketolase